MRFSKKNLLAAVAAGGTAVAGAPAVSAATILDGLLGGGSVPGDHGSNAAGTPNIDLAWSVVQSGSDTWGQWDGYSNWPNDAGNGVYQIEGATDGTTHHIITFTPDAGADVSITSFDMLDWGGGGGAAMLDWSLDGSISGNLGGGAVVVPDGTAVTVNVNLVGTGSESLILSFTQTSPSVAGSYLALDNLSFDQIGVPEPGSAVLALGGLGVLAMRRKRK